MERSGVSSRMDRISKAQVQPVFLSSPASPGPTPSSPHKPPAAAGVPPPPPPLTPTFSPTPADAPAAAFPALQPGAAPCANSRAPLMSLRSREAIRSLKCRDAERKVDAAGRLHGYYSISVVTTLRRFIVEKRFRELRTLHAQLASLFPDQFAPAVPLGFARACYCMPAGAAADSDDEGEGGEGGASAAGGLQPAPGPSFGGFSGGHSSHHHSGHLVTVDLTAAHLDERPHGSRTMEARRRCVGAYLRAVVRNPAMSALVLAFLAGRDTLVQIEEEKGGAVVGDTASLRGHPTAAAAGGVRHAFPPSATASVGAGTGGGGLHFNASHQGQQQGQGQFALNSVVAAPLQAPVMPRGGGVGPSTMNGGVGPTSYPAASLQSPPSSSSSGAAGTVRLVVTGRVGGDGGVAGSMPDASTPVSAAAALSAPFLSSLIGQGAAAAPPVGVDGRPLLPPPLPPPPPGYLPGGPSPPSPPAHMPGAPSAGSLSYGSPRGVFPPGGREEGRAAAGTPGGWTSGVGDNSPSGGAALIASLTSLLNAPPPPPPQEQSLLHPQVGATAPLPPPVIDTAPSHGPWKAHFRKRSDGTLLQPSLTAPAPSPGTPVASCEPGEAVGFSLDDMDAFDCLLEGGWALTYGALDPGMMRMLAPPPPASPSSAAALVAGASSAPLPAPRPGQRVSASWVLLTWDGAASSAVAACWVRSAVFHLCDERDNRIPVGLHAAMCALDPGRAAVRSEATHAPLLVFTAVLDPLLAFGEAGWAQGNVPPGSHIVAHCVVWGVSGEALAPGEMRTLNGAAAEAADALGGAGVVGGWEAGGGGPAATTRGEQDPHGPAQPHIPVHRSRGRSPYVISKENSFVDDELLAAYRRGATPSISHSISSGYVTATGGGFRVESATPTGGAGMYAGRKQAAAAAAAAVSGGKVGGGAVPGGRTVVLDRGGGSRASSPYGPHPGAVGGTGFGVSAAPTPGPHTPSSLTASSSTSRALSTYGVEPATLRGPTQHRQQLDAGGGAAPPMGYYDSDTEGGGGGVDYGTGPQGHRRNQQQGYLQQHQQQQQQGVPTGSDSSNGHPYHDGQYLHQHPGIHGGAFGAEPPLQHHIPPHATNTRLVAQLAINAGPTGNGGGAGTPPHAPLQVGGHLLPSPEDAERALRAYLASIGTPAPEPPQPPHHPNMAASAASKFWSRLTKGPLLSRSASSASAQRATGGSSSGSGVGGSLGGDDEYIGAAGGLGGSNGDSGHPAQWQQGPHGGDIGGGVDEFGHSAMHPQQSYPTVAGGAPLPVAPSQQQQPRQRGVEVSPGVTEHNGVYSIAPIHAGDRAGGAAGSRGGRRGAGTGSAPTTGSPITFLKRVFSMSGGGKKGVLTSSSRKKHAALAASGAAGEAGAAAGGMMLSGAGSPGPGLAVQQEY